MEEGAIEVDSIEPIGFPGITPELARASGFLGVLDLLKVARHGRGQNIYLVRFHYLPPPRQRKPPQERTPSPPAASDRPGKRSRRGVPVPQSSLDLEGSHKNPRSNANRAR